MKIKRKDLLKLIQEACGEVTEPVRLDLEPGRNLDYDNPGEGSYAKQHLYHTSSNAMSLHDQLEDDDDIPAWCIEYLALARHGVGIVKDFLIHRMKKNN
tara:strand:+ start:366 stop:662 length:297 start_codon:yes stop_codon:yes gene_type:complete